MCVRCGSLAAGEQHRHDPRVHLGGAAWSSMAHPSLDCPAKGQPLLSTSGGFSLPVLTVRARQQMGRNGAAPRINLSLEGMSRRLPQLVQQGTSLERGNDA
jgi:hypothetical protein